MADTDSDAGRGPANDASRGPANDAGRGPAQALDALLEPSLGGAPAQPLYSVRAGFLVAFFGGVYASLAFALLNSRRLGRLREDAWLGGALAALWTALLLWMTVIALRGEVPQWLPWVEPGRGHRAVNQLSRLAALAVFGLSYLRLRRYYRAAALVGTAAPSPWAPGFACALGSLAVTTAVVLLAGWWNAR